MRKHLIKNPSIGIFQDFGNRNKYIWDTSTIISHAIARTVSVHVQSQWIGVGSLRIGH